MRPPCLHIEFTQPVGGYRPRFRAWSDPILWRPARSEVAAQRTPAFMKASTCVAPLGMTYFGAHHNAGSGRSVREIFRDERPQSASVRKRNAPLGSALSTQPPMVLMAPVRQSKRKNTMSKIAAGFAGVVLCPVLMFAEPSFSQTPRPGISAPRPVNPSQELTPSPSPNSAPLPPPQNSPSSQLNAPPSPATPGSPADTTQQNAPLQPDTSQQQLTPAQHKGVVSHRHHEAGVDRHPVGGGKVDRTYVTPWSGPYVIERAHGYSAFVVEGRWFRARSVCPGWAAGERVSFRAGPPGWCTLVNRTRHRACPVSCAGWAAWWGL